MTRLGPGQVRDGQATIEGQPGNPSGCVTLRGNGRSLDLAGDAVELHAGGGGDGVAPQVVEEPLRPDHRRDHRSATPTVKDETGREDLRWSQGIGRCDQEYLK